MNSVNCREIYKAPAAPGTRCWCGGEKEKPRHCPKMTQIQIKHEQLLLCTALGLQGAAISGNMIWKTTAREQTGEASSVTSRGPALRDPSHAHGNTSSSMHMNLLRQDQTPIELQNIFCFISSDRNRIKKATARLTV